jgi:uncharacterized membrane protein
MNADRAARIPSTMDLETLGRYDELIPNGAQRILRLMEMERDHRRKVRQAYVTSERRRRLLGKVLCVGLLIEGLVLGWICIMAR